MTHIAIISSGRVAATASMRQMLGDLPATWYVGKDEGDEYAEFTRDDVVEAGGLIDSRNAALDAAFAGGDYCLQLSDDLTGIKFLNRDGTAQPTALHEALAQMHIALINHPRARLGGVAPTNNPFFGKMAVNDHGFCVGDMILVAPTELRFDWRLRLKEDYDYTAQHLLAYGEVARCDWILPTFKHGTNRGGAVAYRTTELEQQAIAYLKMKWPGIMRDNPKRPDEILFKWDAEAARQPSFG